MKVIQIKPIKILADEIKPVDSSSMPILTLLTTENVGIGAKLKTVKTTRTS